MRISEKQNPNRIEYIDLLKLLAIYFVLWGHSLQYLSTNDFIYNKMVEFIYSFHMPLFMVLSGYFFLSSLKFNFFSFFIIKFRQLILPIISFTVLAEIIFLIAKKQYNVETISFGLYLKNVLIQIGLSFWFLKSLFFCYLLSYVLIKIIKIDWLACLISILLCSLNPNVFQLGFMLPFFWLGAFINKYYSYIEKYNVLILGISIILFVILFYFWRGNYMIYYCKIPAIYKFKDPTYIYRIYVTILRFFIGTSGSISFLLLTRYVYSKYNTNLKWLSTLGQYTLGVYILQSYIWELMNKYLVLPHVNILIFNFLLTPTIALILLFFCYFCIKLIEMNKVANLLFLGKRFKQNNQYETSSTNKC